VSHVYRLPPPHHPAVHGVRWTAPHLRWRSLHVPHLQLATLRLRLIKIGGWVRHRLDALSLHLASSHPGGPFWYLVATRPGRS